MLNYNVNFIEPFRRNRNFLLGQIDYKWARVVGVAAGIQSGSIIFGTGSIEYIPYAPTTFFVSGTYDEQRIGSGSALGLPIKIAITGSGVWPVTGSNTFSIVIGGDLGFYQSNILTLSAAAGNMNLSGSKISSSFNPEGNQTYNIDFGLNHTKGNIYNPLVNWNVSNISSLNTSASINGENTASFQIVKNVNEELATITTVTGSNSGSFDYAYNFGVTASLSASINNVTGSTTMSFSIPEEGILQVTKFFNPNTTLAFATGSFVATNDTIHNLTASVEYNKGNLSNSLIKWFITGSGTNLVGSSSFNLKKDVNITMATASFTASFSSSYTNDYAFNQTASISSSYRPYYNSDSSSYYISQLSLEIPEVNFSSSKWISSSLSVPTLTTFTASFTGQTNISTYNITASIAEYYVPVIDYLIIGGGGAGSDVYNPQCYNSRTTGGGAGGLITGSAILSASVSYPVRVGAGGLVRSAQNEPSSDGENSSFINLIAIGGGGAGYDTGNCAPGNIVGRSGGSGGGNYGTGTVGQGNNGDIVLGGSTAGDGNGVLWLDGKTYGAGGGGVQINNVGIVITTPSGTATGIFGNGGRGGGFGSAQNGQSGSVIIRYKSQTQLANGGNVVQSGSYFYHTFTSDGFFEFSPTKV